mgnify:CR=1 FL=1
MIQPTEKKERKDLIKMDKQYEILHRNTCQKGPKIQRII